jgi:hypothetical protein
MALFIIFYKQFMFLTCNLAYCSIIYLIIQMDKGLQYLYMQHHTIQLEEYT